ncbi:MAG: wax ester/triacylglycerol synthase domain-containing protein, partial [Pseudomonadota bacterium]
MRLSTHDASFVYGETANGPMHGVSLTLLDGAVSYDEIFAYYEPRVGKIPRLRQKLAFAPFNLAHPRWVDDPSFDLRNHLIGHRLAPNTTLAQAEAKALELAQGVLDRNRPLWRTFVLEGVEGRTLIASLTHHAFVDGATAVALSTVLTDPSPDPEPQEAAPAWSPEPAPSLLDRWIDAGSAFIEQGAENLRRMRQLPAAEPSRLARVVEALAQPVMQAPWNRSLVGPKRQLAYFTVSLEDIKRIRSAHGGTVNDVAVSTVMEG